MLACGISKSLALTQCGAGTHWLVKDCNSSTVCSAETSTKRLTRCKPMSYEMWAVGFCRSCLWFRYYKINDQLSSVQQSICRSIASVTTHIRLENHSTWIERKLIKILVCLHGKTKCLQLQVWQRRPQLQYLREAWCSVIQYDSTSCLGFGEAVLEGIKDRIYVKKDFW